MSRVGEATGAHSVITLRNNTSSDDAERGNPMKEHISSDGIERLESGSVGALASEGTRPHHVKTTELDASVAPECKSASVLSCARKLLALSPPDSTRETAVVKDGAHGLSAGSGPKLASAARASYGLSLIHI